MPIAATIEATAGLGDDTMVGVRATMVDTSPTARAQHGPTRTAERTGRSYMVENHASIVIVLVDISDLGVPKGLQSSVKTRHVPFACCPFFGAAETVAPSPAKRTLSPPPSPAPSRCLRRRVSGRDEGGSGAKKQRDNRRYFSRNHGLVDLFSTRLPLA